MKRIFRWVIGLLIGAALVPYPDPSPAQSRQVLFRESFQNLTDWRPLYFPKIKKYSVYTSETKDGRTYLKAESDGSASALVYKQEYNIYDYPGLVWRWKVEAVYQKGDARFKEGDDYPLRIYVMFKYDPAKASTLERIKYGAAKAIYGEYPPHSSLNYIWSSKVHPEAFLPNPYADQVMMVLLQKGGDRVGQWIDQEVNVLEDYRRIFKADPPALVSLAVMNDSDNTGEKSTSYLEFIEAFRPEKNK